MTGLLLLVCLSGAPAWTGDESSDEALLARAEASVAEGLRQRDDPTLARKAFAAAAGDYEALVDGGRLCVSLFRNLGNAHLLAGRVAEAIFAYRRGSALDPSDRELRADLDVARGRVRYPPSGVGRPPTDDWPPWLPRLAPPRLVLIGAGCLALFWLLLTRYRMTRHGILLLASGLCVAAAILSFVAAAVEYEFHGQDLAQPLVVMALDGVSLKKGNGDQYPARDNLPPLPAGVEARLLGRRADRQGTIWLRIQLASGEVGWVKRDEALLAE